MGAVLNFYVIYPYSTETSTASYFRLIPSEKIKLKSSLKSTQKDFESIINYTECD